MSNGHGHDQLDPKWQSLVDQWIREVLETMGKKIGALRLKDSEQEMAQVAMARALIYAGSSIIFEHTGNHGEATEEMVNDIIKSFFAEM